MSTYAFPVRVVERLQLDDVGVADDSHDLELTVLEGRANALV